MGLAYVAKQVQCFSLMTFVVYFSKFRHFIFTVSSREEGCETGEDRLSLYSCSGTLLLPICTMQILIIHLLSATLIIHQELCVDFP